MKQKLKGCRPSKDVMQDYSNVSAQLGDVIFQIDRGHHTKQQLLKRQRELMLEMNASQAQEKEIAAQKGAEATNLEVGQNFVADSPEAPLSEVANA